MLLFALSQCYQNQDRLILFTKIDKAFNDIFSQLSLDGISSNSYYSFGKLENDGIWEVTESKNLKRTSVGHLFKKELIEKNICGGFIEEIYEALVSNKPLIDKIINNILNHYINPDLHNDFLRLIYTSSNVVNEPNLIKKRNNSMALIGNQKFALSKWWASKGIELIKNNRDMFSKVKIRETRRELIAGSGVVDGVQGWMQAAQLISRIKSGEYELTNFSRALSANDPKLDKSASWWAVHLAICFSDRSEPYNQFFCNLDNLSQDWIKLDDLKNRINLAIEDAAKASLDSNLEGVRNMFKNNHPLAEIGLIETRKNREQGISIRLGTPTLTDEIILHALAMMRFSYYKSTPTVDFSELTKNGLGHFLCCSPTELREHLRRMKQSNKWHAYFNFNEQINLDSVSFAELCLPDKTLLLLLQEGQDTWL